MRTRTLWGVEGGTLDRWPVQTHCAIGPLACRFYFTVAARAFGWWMRVRLCGYSPFIRVLWGKFDD